MTGATNPVVIRFGRLGDMLLLAPLLARLHRGYGEPCVLFGTGPCSAALYAHHPDVACVYEVAARHRPLVVNPDRWRMLAALQARRHAPVHVCESEPRALAKIRRMLALAGVAPRRCRFLDDAAPRDDEHWVDRLLRGCGEPPAAFAGAWRPPDTPNLPAPRLHLDAVDRHDRDAWLHARGWRGEPLWLVQPCNKRSLRWNGPRDDAADDKAWSTRRWSALVQALAARRPQARILLCGTEREAAPLRRITALARCPQASVVAGDLPLRRLMALAEIAHGMVSVDTGPAHVAAAMGCPLVVLFGAQSPRVWRPRSPTGSVVIALGGPPLRSRVADITLEEAVAAALRLKPREPGIPRAA